MELRGGNGDGMASKRPEGTLVVSFERERKPRANLASVAKVPNRWADTPSEPSPLVSMVRRKPPSQKGLQLADGHGMVAGRKNDAIRQD